MKHRAYLILACVLVVGLAGCDEKPDTTITPETEATTESAEATPSAEPAETETTETAAVQPAETEAPLTATVGQPAPTFELVDQDGTTHKLADYRGKVVVLEWVCPTCPFVQRHYNDGDMPATAGSFDADKVAWLAIDSSNFVTPEKSKAFREEHEIPYPVLQDPTGAVGRQYEARTTPHMFVIDAEGVLRYEGAIDDDPRGREEEPTNYVKQAVDALLAGNDVPMAQTDPYGCSVKYGES